MIPVLMELMEEKGFQSDTKRMFGDYQQPRLQMRQSTRLEVGRARWCIVVDC